MDRINRYDAARYDFKKRISEQNKEINELRKKIRIIQQDNMNLRGMIDSKNHEINSIVNSKSWKITKPLRKIMERVVTDKKIVKNVQDDLIHDMEEYKHDYRNFMPYNSYYQKDEDFSNLKTDIKALAFYLPQYHCFKENDEWWGKGFMEWTNTKKAKPHFEGHYQPREPHDDIGYYTLDNIDTMKHQIELAKKHGIYGFCFYYYWFSGKRLMEKPVDMLLEHSEIDFPFCLCWANENWSRTWDGSDNEILIKQDYSTRDYKTFIYDIKKYFDDKRYIRIDGKPLIMIYNPVQIPNLDELVYEWRKNAKEAGIGEIVVWTKNDLARDDFKNMEFVDAEFDFVPNGMGHDGCKVTGLDTQKAYDYSQMVDDIKHLYEEHFPLKPFYYSCTMGWDNSARRKQDYKIYYNYSLSAFYKWLRIIIEETRYRNDINNRFVLINAWNEWAEGTYLEPDKKYGYANINTLSRALFDLPLNSKFSVINSKSEKLTKLDKKIAIQVHIYYVDLIDEIISYLNNVPYKYDLFISTDCDKKVKEIKEKICDKLKNAKNVIIKKYDNRGRDVLPFLLQMREGIEKYDYICHIHTKKTITDVYGNNWRKYLYNSLLGSSNYLKSIFNIFENDLSVGLMYPMYFHEIFNLIGIGRNEEKLNNLLDNMNIVKPNNYDNLNFPAGTMFWAKVDALKPLFSLNLNVKDFDEENGQVDGTIAHAIERSLCLIANSQGYECVQVINRIEDKDI